MSHAGPLLHVPQPLFVANGPGQVVLEPLSVHAGEWLLLCPEHDQVGADPAVAIVRALTALEAPHAGELALFGADVAALGQAGLSALRTRLALVPGSGGLLSNRTLRENVALPLSVHRALRLADEEAEVAALLVRFALSESADLFPHQVAGATRHRACVARATVLGPALYVVEGSGEFAGAHHVGLSWTRLREEKAARGAALVACVARLDDDFAQWFSAQGGRVSTYRSLARGERPVPSIERPSPR